MPGSRFIFSVVIAPLAASACILAHHLAIAAPIERDVSILFFLSQSAHAGSGSAPILIDTEVARVEGSAEWVDAYFSADLISEYVASFDDQLDLGAARDWSLLLDAKWLRGDYFHSAGVTVSLDAAFVKPTEFVPERILYVAKNFRAPGQIDRGVAGVSAAETRIVSRRKTVGAVITALDGTFVIEHAGTFAPSALAAQLVATHEDGTVRKTSFRFSDLREVAGPAGRLTDQIAVPLDLSLPGQWSLRLEDFSLSVDHQLRLLLSTADLAIGYGIPLFANLDPDGCGDFGTDGDNSEVSFGANVPTCREDAESRFDGVIEIANTSGTLQWPGGGASLGIINVVSTDDPADPVEPPDKAVAVPLAGAWLLLATGMVAMLRQRIGRMQLR